MPDRRAQELAEYRATLDRLRVMGATMPEVAVEMLKAEQALLKAEQALRILDALRPVHL